ncbi:hypothetical protein CALCODRAFT_311234 [Calocera cornea HHB12733]|uniref:Uncharacterized protein n=1 Tax=Calocera cornea HHB12733 TaxID=1353952 RepID=A0A165FFD3_9BASI|nr:hypothetical protein CALCODRAFT_311234 [Calocera cornea HHB12733]
MIDLLGCEFLQEIKMLVNLSSKLHLIDLLRDCIVCSGDLGTIRTSAVRFALDGSVANFQELEPCIEHLAHPERVRRLVPDERPSDHRHALRKGLECPATTAMRHNDSEGLDASGQLIA